MEQGKKTDPDRKGVAHADEAGADETRADEAGRESFPASDPPATTVTGPGEPGPKPDKARPKR